MVRFKGRVGATTRARVTVNIKIRDRSTCKCKGMCRGYFRVRFMVSVRLELM
jgi:hypothetical protein